MGKQQPEGQTGILILTCGVQEYSHLEGLLHTTRLRRRAAPSFGTDRRGNKQKKRAGLKRQTGKSRLGSAAQGARQLDSYAWLQVGQPAIQNS